MRLKAHYVMPEVPLGQHRQHGPHLNGELLNTLQAGFKYIENESFQSTFSGLFSEINLGSDKLGKTYFNRNAKLCTIITRVAEGLAEFSTDSDTLATPSEYLMTANSPLARARRPVSSTRRSGYRTSSDRRARQSGAEDWQAEARQR